MHKTSTYLAFLLLLSLSGCVAGLSDAPCEAGLDQVVELAASDEPPPVAQKADFAPVLRGVQAGITYTDQYGHYTLIGDLAVVFVDLEWINADGARASDGVVIVPPLAPAQSSGGNRCGGVLEYSSSDFGDQAEEFDLVSLSLQQAGAVGEITVLGRSAGMSGARAILHLGDGDVRRVTGTIVYRTTGQENY
jgi:hypothetical protein